MPERSPTDVLVEVGEVLGYFRSAVITGTQYDGDDSSGSLIIVTKDPHQEFIISSKDVKEVEPGGEHC